MTEHHSSFVENTPKVQFPTLTDLLARHRNNIMSALRVMLPATITAVHSDKGTVDVRIAVMQVDADTAIPFSYPPILGVPVVTLYGGGPTAVAAMFPVAPGDQCLVFFSDRCMDAWKLSGTPTPLPNLRTHDLADGFALVGVNAPGPLFPSPFVSANEGGIASVNAKVVVNGATGLISVKNNAENLATVMANLGTALTALITALSALTVNTSTGVVTPATVTALTAVQTQFTAVQTALAALLY